MQTFTITSKEVAFLLLVYLFQMIYIPEEQFLRAWLVDSKGKILLVGNPADNPSLVDLFHQEIDKLHPSSYGWGDVLYMEVLPGVYSEFRE